MAAVVLVTAVIVIFIAGAITGVIVLVSLASHREDRRKLSREAPNWMALAGRFVTGLQVAGPSDYRVRRGDPDDSELEMSGQTYQGQTPDAP